MTTRLLAALFAVLLTLTGCGADGPTADDQSAIEEDNGAGDATENEDDVDSGGADKGKNAKPGAAGTGEGAGENDDGTRVAGRGGGGGAESGDDDGSSSWYPQQGVYTYAQSGWEEFCDATSCNKDDLPNTQEVRTSYKEQRANAVVVVTEAEASDNRFVRTTTRHTPDGAFVTNVYIKFSYQNTSFNNSYEPDPPVEVLRLPLESGMSWSGEWSDRTSGDYEIEVGAREAVKAGGRTVQAFPLHSLTHFRGDFDGTSRVTVWIDPATAAVVKTKGAIDVDSFFGTYRSEFTATLRDGPAYH
ncbi:MAG TPA: hypothetical protein VG408_01705 [Actinomycetota bacterium]|nr:hypothetical protein [Actinomycetota bacterium]